MMIIKRILTISILFVNCAYYSKTHGAAEERYLQRLPDESLVRQVDTNTSPSWFFKSAVEKELNYVEEVLRKTHTVPTAQQTSSIGGYWGDVFATLRLAGNKARMKNAIRIIIPTASDEEKWREFDLISTLASTLEQERRAREQREREERERAARERFLPERERPF